jgi:hypothetical protein
MESDMAQQPPAAAVLCAQVPVVLVHEVLSSRPKTLELSQRYDEFALRSFVEDNRSLVWCTGARSECWRQRPPNLADRSLAGCAAGCLLLLLLLAWCLVARSCQISRPFCLTGSGRQDPRADL